MTASNSSRKRRSDPAEFPSAYTRQRPDPAAGVRLWKHYRAEPTVKNRDALAVHYLPMVLAFSAWLRGRKLALADRRLDELVSDCSVGLLDAIRDWPGDDAARFPGYAMSVMKNRAFEGAGEQVFCWSKRKAARRRLLRKFRRRFVLEHGRLPTREESHAHLRTVVTNKAIHLADGPRVFCLADLSNEDEGERARTVLNVRPDPHARPAPSALLDKE